MSKPTAAQKRIWLQAADRCRAIQASYYQQAKKVRGRDDIKSMLHNCSTGAGACASEMESMAGLSLKAMCKRGVATVKTPSTNKDSR